MPWVLTRGNDGAEIGYRVAGFISEWWPTSNRNGDRHRLGKGGRHASECLRVQMDPGATSACVL